MQLYIGQNLSLDSGTMTRDSDCDLKAVVAITVVAAVRVRKDSRPVRENFSPGWATQAEKSYVIARKNSARAGKMIDKRGKM